MHSNVSPEPGLAETQASLCAHLRNPAVAAAPAGLSPRRLGIYRELVFKNISSLLATSLPVCTAILEQLPGESGDDAWLTLVREFIATHRAQTPLFTELPSEFLAFIRQQETRREPDFLAELAEYEILELQLLYRDEDPDAAADIPYEQARLRLSRLACLRRYRYPVHQLGGEQLTAVTGDTPTLLLLHRNGDRKVSFRMLSEAAHALLASIEAHPGHSAADWLALIDAQRGSTPAAEESSAAHRSLVLHGAEQLLRDLYACGVLYSHPE